jgi:hypothetical protein
VHVSIYIAAYELKITAHKQLTIENEAQREPQKESRDKWG